MKITRRQLRRIIREAFAGYADERPNNPMERAYARKEQQQQDLASQDPPVTHPTSRPGREPGVGKRVPMGGGFPNMSEWWNEEPDDVLSFVYWLKGQFPPIDPDKRAEAWKSLSQQLELKHPSPSSI